MNKVDKNGISDMCGKNLLILERSSENLTKVSGKNNTVLEGIFCVFGQENRNKRIYQESEYLQHLPYLNDLVTERRLLGELDHPERFEVHLQDASHVVTDIWYDSSNRQLKGRVEILKDTPKGKIAQALIDAGVPLSISSRAAGRVMEDKTVKINQIYTYDLVANPGFASAVLYNVNESLRTDIDTMVEQFNKVYENDVTDAIGISDSTIKLYDVSEQYSSSDVPSEYTVINNEEKKDKNMSKDNKTLESEIESIREEFRSVKKILQKNIQWNTQMAKTINEMVKSVNESSNSVELLKGKVNVITETVNNNATVLDNVSEWTSSIAKTVNTVGNTLDHNADVLNTLTEWVGENAKATNQMNGWVEKISEELNITMNYAESMFGEAMCKEDGLNIMNVVSHIKEGKDVDHSKIKSIYESLSKDTFTGEFINESAMDSLRVLDTPRSISVSKEAGVTGINDMDTSFDPKKGVFKATGKNTIFTKSKRAKGLDTMDVEGENVKITHNSIDGVNNDLSKPSTISHPTPVDKGNLPVDAKSTLNMSDEHHKTIHQKKDLNAISKKLKETHSFIIESVESERQQKYDILSKYPFAKYLNEDNLESFMKLDESAQSNISKNYNRYLLNNPNTSSDKIYESVSILNNINTEKDPQWLADAPSKYRAVYESLSEVEKLRVKTRAEFYQLDTQNKINEFWKSTNLKSEDKQVIASSLNESVNNNMSTVDDKFVKDMGDLIKYYN